MPERITTQLAETLASRVRVITARQIAQYYFAGARDPMAAAGRCVRSLRRVGLTNSWPAAIGEVWVVRPLAVSDAEHAMPDLGAIAWQNEKRWKQARPQKAVCVVATQAARDRFAGACREPRPQEVEHDLVLTNVYLHLLKTDPEAAATWRHEDSGAAKRGKRADATYHRAGVETSIDVLGRGYSKSKIEALWHAYEGQSLELW